MLTVKLLGTICVKLKVKIEGGEGMWGADGNKEKKAEEEREEEEKAKGGRSEEGENVPRYFLLC